MLYVVEMETLSDHNISSRLLSELERTYFWWEPIGSEPRSAERIIAQAMSFAGFEDIVRLQKDLGPDLLTEIMLKAEPGWIDERSWEFWRGRLMRATNCDIPVEPPVRSFDVGTV